MPKDLRFDTVRDFVAQAHTVPSKWHTGGHNIRLPYLSVVEMGLTGDDTLVPEAQRMLDQLEVDSLEVPVRQWSASPYGAYPIIPEYLSGMPTPMRAMQAQEVDSTPIGVWVNLSSSACISLSQLKQRGIAILALVLKLQQIRPLDLYICAGDADRQTTLTITLNTRPLDLATTAYMLCNGEWGRFPMYAVCRQAQNDNMNMGYGSEQSMRDAWKIPNTDICVPRYGGQTMEATGKLLEVSPLEWLNEQLRKYSTK